MMRATLVIRWEHPREDRLFDCALKLPGCLVTRGPDRKRLVFMAPRRTWSQAVAAVTEDLCTLIEEVVAASPWASHIGEDNDKRPETRYCPEALLPRRLNKKTDEYEQDPIELLFQETGEVNDSAGC